MHVHFEQNNSSRTECTIHSLSWMGKVPDVPDNNGGWKLNRNQYYMEGWLASGNAKGVVGVTFTTSHCKKYDPPPRSNFNLRGHKSEVSLPLFQFVCHLWFLFKLMVVGEKENNWLNSLSLCNILDPTSLWYFHFLW